MRNFLIWTLSLLLGFQPAAMAQGQANKQAEIKAFLEKSELGRKPQTFKEMYHKLSSEFTESEVQQIRTFAKLTDDAKLPKFEIRKVKSSNGKEYYQLQGVGAGKSITAEIYGEQNQYMRINGVVLSAADMHTPGKTLAKLRVPAKEIAQYFPKQKPQRQQMISFEQLQKLPKADQKKYFKQMRDLLEAMEAVQQSGKGTQTSGYEANSSKLELIALLLQGELAQAAFTEGDKCVAGGRIAIVRRDSKKGLSCGSDGNGGVAEEYRRKGNGGLCPQGTFSCNPLIYKGTDSYCSGAGRDTTRNCNNAARTSGEDIPDIAQNLTDLRDFRTEALAEATIVKNFCDNVLSGSSSGSTQDAPARPSKGKKAGVPQGSKKGSSGNGPNGLEIDQRQTCENFITRYEEIISWDCGNESFKQNKNYKKLCDEPVQAPAPALSTDQSPEAPAPTSAPGQAPPADQAPAKPAKPNCEQLPPGHSTEPKCEGGGVLRADFTCDDGKPVFTCSCDDGSNPANFRCKAPERETGRDKDSVKKKKKDGPNWLLIGGIFGAGLLLFHWLNKRAAKQMYNQLEPVPQNPPLPAPTVINPVPTPRGSQ